MDVNIIYPVLTSAFVAGLFGALKYYSNTIGTNPEQFSMMKFAPIVILSVIVSVGFALGANQMFTADMIVEYLTANFTLVAFANTVFSIMLKKLNLSL